MDFKQSLHSSSQDGCQYRQFTARDMLLRSQVSLSLDKCDGLAQTQHQYNVIINYNNQGMQRF